MEDSTPGSTEDQNQGGQQPSPDQSQQVPADIQGQTPASSDDTQGSANDDTPQVNQDSNEDGGNDDAGQAGQSEDEVAEWAKKQGYDLDNLTAEQAKTLAKRVIDNQKAYHEAQGKLKAADTVSDSISDISGDNEPSQTDKELAALRTERFFARNEGAEQYAGKMADLVKQEGEAFGEEAAWRLANNLPRLLTLAKAEVDSKDTSQYDQGRQDERRNLAASQQAGAPVTSAVSTAPTSTTVTDASIGNMSTEEYLKWKAEGGNPWAVPVK